MQLARIFILTFIDSICNIVVLEYALAVVVIVEVVDVCHWTLNTCNILCISEPLIHKGYYSHLDFFFFHNFVF